VKIVVENLECWSYCSCSFEIRHVLQLKEVIFNTYIYIYYVRKCKAVKLAVFHGLAFV